MRRLNIFGYNSENDRNFPEGVSADRFVDGREFIVSEISDEQRERVDALEDKVEKLTDKSDCVLPAKYLAYIPAILSIACLAAATRLKPPLTVIFLVMGLALLAVYAFVSIKISARRRELSAQDRAILYPPLGEAIKELAEAEKELLSGFGFDGNEIKIDAFHPVYENDEDYQSYECDKEGALCLPVFIETVGDTLKLSEFYVNFDIPVSCVKRIERINRGGSFIRLIGEYMLPATMPEGVTVKRERYLTTVEYSHYYALVIEKDGTEYELTFPPYELDKVIGATGISLSEPTLG